MMARDVNDVDVGAALQQVGLVIITNVFARGRHAVWLYRLIQWQQIAHRSPNLISAIALLVGGVITVRIDGT